MEHSSNFKRVQAIPWYAYINDMLCIYTYTYTCTYTYTLTCTYTYTYTYTCRTPGFQTMTLNNSSFLRQLISSVNWCNMRFRIKKQKHTLLALIWWSKICFRMLVEWCLIRSNWCGSWNINDIWSNAINPIMNHLQNDNFYGLYQPSPSLVGLRHWVSHVHPVPRSPRRFRRMRPRRPCGLWKDRSQNLFHLGMYGKMLIFF